ncbi:MAG TPA: tetratricopeptide repeat protein [Pyrinomonadaceae bacterium]|jgi:tetratricopeptide (TPR) repeat protein
MFGVKKLCALVFVFALAQAFAAPHVRAQAEASNTYHQIEGRLQFRTGSVGSVRVRLLRLPDMRPIAETFSRPEGQFIFSFLIEGGYVVETIATDKFEATATNVMIRPLLRGKPTVVTVLIELPLKASPERVAPGVITADVDLNVPKTALKHYRAGMKALEEGDAVRGVTQLREAIAAHPKYYAARLELGRELRTQKRFAEALEALQPLAEIAPKRAEPRIESGIVLLGLERFDAAAKELEAALRLEETNWAAHLYLGWSLLEKDGEKAATHFRRAIELDEQKAARAHLSLARLADAKGERAVAIQHLDAYLAISPDAHDSESVRKLAERLRAAN